MSQINISERNTQSEQISQLYPPLTLSKTRFLAVVKTQPNPSIKYRETVCTAGITADGRWIRLYPLPFRYTPYNQRFRKYQWIEVHTEKADPKDFRIDSYRPKIETITPIGKPLPGGSWDLRKKVLLPTISESVHELDKKYAAHRISIGMIKPVEITNFIIERGDQEWSKKHKQVLSQQVLFGEQPKELEKIPFKFSYRFSCDDDLCNGHKMQIMDWEITELYRKMIADYPFEIDTALQKVKDKFFTELCGPTKDTYFIIGTTFPNPTFNVLGVFWPPKM